MIYDLVVIGAGLAGVAATKLASSKGMSVLLLEKGRELRRRRDPISGWFGRSLFSMNRLELDDPLFKNKKAFQNAVDLIQKQSDKKLKIIEVKSKGLVPKKFCRLSSDFAIKLAAHFLACMNDKIHLSFNTEVLKVTKHRGKFNIQTSAAKTFKARKCLLATGRHSFTWIKSLCGSFNITPSVPSVKIGVRVEVPTFVVEGLLSGSGDIAEKYDNVVCDDARLNSFVGEWEESDIISALGYGLPGKKSEKTNFMLGVEPEVEAEEVIRSVRITNVLANDRIRKERVRDYIDGKTILKNLSIFADLKQAFEKMEAELPMFLDFATIYIPEVRKRGIFPVTDSMKTKVSGLYGAGECSTKVSTLVGALASGSVAAETILGE